jgi:hypothetical protein
MGAAVKLSCWGLVPTIATLGQRRGALGDARQGIGRRCGRASLANAEIAIK